MNRLGVTVAGVSAATALAFGAGCGGEEKTYTNSDIDLGVAFEVEPAQAAYEAFELTAGQVGDTCIRALITVAEADIANDNERAGRPHIADTIDNDSAAALVADDCPAAMDRGDRVKLFDTLRNDIFPDLKGLWAGGYLEDRVVTAEEWSQYKEDVREAEIADREDEGYKLATD
ncbi:MAG TPA: hypothetical protein VK674_00920 [Candidatus Limnocylindria bacterium]|nr:hypothetical protein [Candidatus Limnocylindria bacterium]